MIICGLKLTHDGAVALLDDDHLVFSVEMEKLRNSPRYSTVEDIDVIPGVLADFGYHVDDVAEWVVDGWDGDKLGAVQVSNEGRPVTLIVGPYREPTLRVDLFRPSYSGQFVLAGRDHPYTSYSHAAGHVASTYCTSPFATRGEPSFVL